MPRLQEAALARLRGPWVGASGVNPRARRTIISLLPSLTVPSLDVKVETMAERVALRVTDVVETWNRRASRLR